MTACASSRPATGVALALLLAASLAACSSVERSRSLSDERVPARTIATQVCSNCHGMRGVSTSPNFPHLAAQPPAYLEAQLRAFRGHGRSDPAGFEYMWGISSRLTDQQIADLSTYYAQQPAPGGRSGNATLEQRGRAIFANGNNGVPACASCHGAHGEGMGTFPRLAGQHADYVSKQLAVFQRTDQRPEGAVMKTVAHALSQDDIDCLSLYVASIKPGG
ncbi:c-type cytochrome [Rugamonas apoptosis]|uniref:Cytochrome c4 n=1 Tax=Rugamonas apoptosis TaxID=2758570 RepID=A0A7W2IJ50_9BURK|nr:c-type cytochrome [Rugamonas apoptosis]MBA5686134.1 cytochrome c4 [Rugamonas apoptosis]